MAQLIDTTVNGKLEVIGETNLLGTITPETRQSINYIGENPILNTDNDTVENWIALGTGHAYFNANILNSQPVQHGFFENIVADPNAVSQVFTSYTTGTISRKWARTGSITYGWGDWVMIHNENTPQYIKIYKTNDTTDYSTSYNYFDPLCDGITTSIVKGNLEAGSYTFDTYGDRSNYLVRGVYIGAGVHIIRISYSVRFLNNSETRTVLLAAPYRLRNGTSSIIAQSHLTQGYGRATLSDSSIVTAQEGDFIFLQGYKGTKSLDIDVIGGTGTQMTIEVIR